LHGSFEEAFNGYRIGACMQNSRIEEEGEGLAVLFMKLPTRDIHQIRRMSNLMLLPFFRDSHTKLEKRIETNF
jgi:hypothetical protein